MPKKKQPISGYTRMLHTAHVRKMLLKGGTPMSLQQFAKEQEKKKGK